MRVVYIILRNDLNFKSGPLAAQAAHAVSLLIHKHHELMKDYLDQEYGMRKIILGGNELEFKELKIQLETQGIKYVEWLEYPENVVTALCTTPIEPSERPKLLKKINLF